MRQIRFCPLWQQGIEFCDGKAQFQVKKENVTTQVPAYRMAATVGLAVRCDLSGRDRPGGGDPPRD